jgi:hypothetical protein
MTLLGHIRAGQIVPDDPVTLPEGAAVQIEVLESALPAAEEIPTLYERLKPIVGRATGLPADASSNVDHYLYGHPQQ